MVPRDARSSRDPYKDDWGVVQFPSVLTDISGDIESFTTLWCYETMIYYMDLYRSHFNVLSPPKLD